MFQSTHPHGVRRLRLLRVKLWTTFQSTHPHGVRLSCRPQQHPAGLFQSTHPHGVRRPSPWQQRPVVDCFNPRTRTGCDLLPLLPLTMQRCFNPRTRTGCDPACGRAVNRFQSTHPHGVRRSLHPVDLSTCSCFNPRTRTGCDCT